MRKRILSVATAALTVAALAGGAVSGDADAAPQGKASAAKVSVADFKFTPETITIKRGETVRWKHVSGSHTLTFFKGHYDRGLNFAQPTQSRTFKRAGTFKYFCRFHLDDKGMKGKVVVK